MKHCLVLAPFLLSSAAAFTTVHQQFQSFVSAATDTSSSASLKMIANNFDYHGTSDRIQEAYKAWCRVYNKTDTSRLEIFAYHFLLAEKFFGQTGAPIKLNEYADLTSAEYMALQENGSLPQVEEPSEVIVSETKASDYAVPVPEPQAPADYGPTAASYLEALSAASQASSTLSGGGMTSYLDSVSSSSTSTSLGGAGMTSYLDSVSNASPLSNDYAAQVTSAAAPVPEPYVPPPAAPAVEVPSTPAAASTAASSGNYMDHLSASSSTSSNTPQGGGMTSYLDSVPTNGAIRGAGMTSYLDSVASSTTYTPFEAPAPAAPEPFVPPVAAEQPIIPSPPPAPPAQPYIPAPSNTIADTGGSYMDNLSAASSITTSGAGITSYLDTVPSTAAACPSGAGMTSYLDNMGTASDFATVETPPPAAEPVQEPIAPPVIAQPPPVQQEAIAPPVQPLVVHPRQPAPHISRPSRNLPGAHWMDTVTPISSYGSHGVNGEWDDSNYQAANDRYKRRQAARRYQRAQAAAYNTASSPFGPSTTTSPSPPIGQEYQPQASYQAEDQQQQQQQQQQESIAPLAERVQRRQRRQVETFGGGFIIS